MNFLQLLKYLAEAEPSIIAIIKGVVDAIHAIHQAAPPKS